MIFSEALRRNHVRFVSARLPALDVGHKLLRTIDFHNNSNCVTNTRILTNNALDFAQFNTETTKLNLEVHTTDKLNVAIRKHTSQITSTIDASVTTTSKDMGERIGDKCIGSQCRAPVVTMSQSQTTNAQFTRSTDRKKLKGLGAHNEMRVIVNRNSQSEVRRTSRKTRTPVGRQQGCFSGAIPVIEQLRPN